MNDLAIIDKFTQVFSRYIDSGFGLLGGEVAFLTATLVVIDMTLAGLWWAMGGQDDVMAKLIKKVLYVGAFAFIIGNFNALSAILFKSFAGLGLIASGSSLSITEFLQPGRLAQVGVDAGAPLLKRIGELSGITKVFANLDTIVILFLAWIVVVLGFLVLAIQLFITLIEFKLTTLAGFVLVPFALWNKTSFLAEKVLGNVVSAGIKVLVLAVIMGISTHVFNDFRTGLGPEPTMNQAVALMLASLAMLGLGIFGPGIATGLVSGAPQLGAGAAAGTALGVAGVAAAGVAGAGLAARTGLAAGRAGVGGVRVGASVAKSARNAYVEGASFSGQTGGMAVAAGLQQVARTGAASVGKRLKAGLTGAGAGSGGASSSTASPAPNQPPAWAKRAQARQGVAHGAAVAAHAVRSGDGGGGGSSSPSLRDDSNS